jgi:hypothetical protein
MRSRAVRLRKRSLGGQETSQRMMRLMVLMSLFLQWNGGYAWPSRECMRAGTFVLAHKYESMQR